MFKGTGHQANVLSLTDTCKVKQAKPFPWLSLLLDTRSQSKTWWGVSNQLGRLRAEQSNTITSFSSAKGDWTILSAYSRNTVIIKQPFQITISSLPLLQETGMAPPINVVHVQIWPGGIYGLSLFSALALLRGFFSGFSSFPPSAKTNITKFQFNQVRGPPWKPADEASSINIEHFINLFIKYLFYPL